MYSVCLSWPRSPLVRLSDRHLSGMDIWHVYLVICCFSTKNATHIVYLIVNKRSGQSSLQVTNYYQTNNQQTAKLSSRLQSQDPKIREPSERREYVERRERGESHCIHFANHAAPNKILSLEFIQNHAANKSQRCLHKLSNLARSLLAMFTQDLTWQSVGREIVVKISDDVRACVLKRLEIGEWLRFNALKRPGPKAKARPSSQPSSCRHSFRL